MGGTFFELLCLWYILGKCNCINCLLILGSSAHLETVTHSSQLQAQIFNVINQFNLLYLLHLIIWYG